MSEEVKYVGIQPTLVTNVGVSETGRLSYLKADISLQVKSPSAHGALLSHMPAVRNLLVLALSRQDQATVSSADGRESLRAEALKELQAFFQKESGSPVVSDLLFTNFIVQT
ncbi:MAG: flagellar basal body-associated FliL family protein [Pseudomonadales bacterium]